MSLLDGILCLTTLVLITFPDKFCDEVIHTLTLVSVPSCMTYFLQRSVSAAVHLPNFEQLLVEFSILSNSGSKVSSTPQDIPYSVGSSGTTHHTCCGY
jgi:hypothetical protein